MVSSNSIKEMLSCDCLDPCRKIRYLAQERIWTVEMVLLALQAVDCVLKAFSNLDRALYLLDDKSIIEVMRPCIATTNCTDGDIIESLILLDFSKLIYRFPCARKFRIEDSGLKQYRINSWGKEYLSANNMFFKFQEEYLAMRTRANTILQEFKQDYDLLFVLLNNPITPETANRILSENQALPIKLLS